MSKRTNKQNNSLHLYFQFVSEQLNELGLEYDHKCTSLETISSMYTPNIVKEKIWKPLQLALFDKKSTTELNTKEIDYIIDVITKFFGEKGVYIEFPNKETLKNGNI